MREKIAFFRFPFLIRDIVLRLCYGTDVLTALKTALYIPQKAGNNVFPPPDQEAVKWNPSSIQSTYAISATFTNHHSCTRALS